MGPPHQKNKDIHNLLTNLPNHQAVHPGVDLQAALDPDPTCLSLNVGVLLGSPLEIPEAETAGSKRARVGGDSSKGKQAAATVLGVSSRRRGGLAPGTWSAAEAEAMRAPCGPLRRRTVKSVMASAAPGKVEGPENRQLVLRLS